MNPAINFANFNNSFMKCAPHEQAWRPEYQDQDNKENLQPNKFDGINSYNIFDLPYLENNNEKNVPNQLDQLIENGKFSFEKIEVIRKFGIVKTYNNGFFKLLKFYHERPNNSIEFRMYVNSNNLESTTFHFEATANLISTPSFNEVMLTEVTEDNDDQRDILLKGKKELKIIFNQKDDFIIFNKLLVPRTISSQIVQQENYGNIINNKSCLENNQINQICQDFSRMRINN